MKSYAIDLLVHQGDAAADAETLAYEFMGHITRSHITQHESAGIGSDLRFTSDVVFGAALEVEDEVIHLNAFPSEGEESTGPGSRLASYLERRRSIRG